MSEERGQLVGEKYQLIEEVGAGGMGSVWRARHIELEVDVALKRLSPQYLSAPEALDRFRREARAAARMRHPNIVHIFDYGVENGIPYMAMELLEGEDLGTLLERQIKLSPARILEILRPVCKALKQAHAAGLVHRDLKPSNIFLSRQGGEEIVKILDFGVVKEALDDGGIKTGSDVLLGTPLYMSPEQTKAAPLDARSDLWSMGVVIFELATGENPFRGTALGDVFGKISWEPLPVPTQWEPSLPAGADSFMARALARRAEDRFESAGELLEAWQAVVEGRPMALPALPAIGRGRLDPTGALPAAKMAETLPMSAVAAEQLAPSGSLPMASANPTVASAKSTAGTSASHPPIHLPENESASRAAPSAGARRVWAVIAALLVALPIAYFVVTNNLTEDVPVSGVQNESDVESDALDGSPKVSATIGSSQAVTPGTIASAEVSAADPPAASATPPIAPVVPTSPPNVAVWPTASVNKPPKPPPVAPPPKPTGQTDPVFGVEVKGK